jgi:ATP adenylyltransferase
VGAHATRAPGRNADRMARRAATLSSDVRPRRVSTAARDWAPGTFTAMAEQRLWAPWRLRYVQGERKDNGCIFCVAAACADDEERHVLARGERCFVMLNAFPYNSGHLMVSPHRHVASIEDLDAAELLELMTLAQRTLRALRDAYHPAGFNLGINEGEVAGAGFAGHVHLHVVPRWAADSNFMAVTADTRVLPQSLQDSYATLRARLSV